MDVGVKISNLRTNRKLTQPELANHLGISQTALCEIESGKTKKIDFLLMNKVCKFFDVDFEYFINDKGGVIFEKIEKTKALILDVKLM